MSSSQTKSSRKKLRQGFFPNYQPHSNGLNGNNLQELPDKEFKVFIPMFKQLEAVTAFQESGNSKELNEISKSICDMEIEFNKEIKVLKKVQAEMMFEKKN